MRTFIICILSVVISSNVLLSQSYKYIKNYYDDIYNMIPGKDTTFYAIAVHPGCGKNNFTVRYINRHGDVMRNFEAPITVAGMTVFEGLTDQDNSLTLLYEAVGYNIIIKIDTAGNLLFGKTFNPNGYKFNKINKIGSSYYLTGSKIITNPQVDSSSAVVVKLNASGAYQWSKVYKKSGHKNLVFTDCKVRRDSLLIGGYYNNGLNPSYPFLAMVDTQGNIGQQFAYVIDSTMFLFEPYRLTNLDFYSDSIVYFKFRASPNVNGIMQLDDQLNPVWTKDISTDVGTICATYDDGLLFNTSLCFNSRLIKTDVGGTITDYYANQLTGSQGSATATFVFRHDCGYLVGTQVGWPSDIYAHIPTTSGYCNGVTTPPMAYAEYPITSVIRRPLNIQSTPVQFSTVNAAFGFTDSSKAVNSFCIVPFVCSSGNELSSENEDVPSTLTIYPNPASDYIYIDVPENTTQISIYNTWGQVLYTGPKNDGMFDISAYPTGLYFVRAGMEVERFVRE